MNLTVTQLCKCLADENRLRLMALMEKEREICVCDLVAALDSPQSTVSRHLAQLRQCELVVARREGTWMHYRLNPALPEWAIATLDTLLPPAREQLGITPIDTACC
ncbi:arsenic resistance transcriptional regulator [Alcanivorax xiamenensis]|uniref:Arsenic resistance transcriptional regulator n=1 Tax=Alcanivorax xiamenensis TaxID=1177156 RepID=A0ABQ6YDX3_9GAMM|nr:metalloregulator ArsR/SmtB family transcription factor [Alcanivorax xiamenensis]KAF0808526.1 arsenic resistance transcriptional regulator [Alcanivorax xiamenensis]